MTLQKWLQATTKTSHPRLLPGCSSIETRQRLECNDGFTVSVQASEVHYCTPRDNAGPWTHVELGYPSAACRTLLPFAEDRKCPTETIYAQVPVEVLERIIRRHGGIREAIADAL
jgi:hypothetical protein